MSFNYTPRQLEIMKFLGTYREEHGVSPTLSEIGAALGVHRVTMHQHVNALVKKGAVSRLPQRSRSIQILDPDFLPDESDHILFGKIKDHVGHKVVAVVYGKEGEPPVNAAIECETCGCVITDADA